jgi:hypothetical protein
MCVLALYTVTHPVPVPVKHLSYTLHISTLLSTVHSPSGPKKQGHTQRGDHYG